MGAESELKCRSERVVVWGSSSEIALLSLQTTSSSFCPDSLPSANRYSEFAAMKVSLAALVAVCCLSSTALAQSSSSAAQGSSSSSAASGSSSGNATSSATPQVTVSTSFSVRSLSSSQVSCWG